MKKIIFIITFLIIFISIFISCEKKSQNLSIKGQVLDENGSPIPNVEIIILETQEKFFTNEDGTFIINYPFEKKTYTIRFHKEGFVDEERKVDLINDEVEIEVYLSYNTYEKITKRGTIIIGTSLDSKPLSYSEGGSKLGFEIDLIRRIANSLALSPVILNIKREELLDSLVKREIDLIISSISEKEINFELKDEIIFSRPYFIDGYVIIVRENENRIRNFYTLNGRNVYVTEKKLIDIVKSYSPTVKKVEHETCMEYALEDLQRVITDAIVTKYSVASYYTKRYKKIKIIDDVYDLKSYSIILRKDDEEVLKKINDTISNLIISGEFSKIYSRWFFTLDKFKVN